MYYRNEFECGCMVVGDNAGCYTIEYCPLHKTAPELYEACKSTLIDWVGTCREYGIPQEDMEVVEKVLKQAIAKAEVN